MSSIASKIRSKRLALGLTQSDVCRIAGVSRQTVIAAEQGKLLQLAAMQNILGAIGLVLDVGDLQEPPPRRKMDLSAIAPATRGQRFPMIHQVMARAQRQGGYV
jgi:transcriptional regulator with XRE-family HTH domain